MGARSKAGCWLIAVTLLTSPAARGQGGADEALAAARSAIGGAEQLAAVKALSLKGSVRLRNQLFGTMKEARVEYHTYPFETNLLLPDHVLERRDLGQGGTAYAGFAGNALLNRYVSADGRSGGTYPPDMLQRERASAGLLMLQLLLHADADLGYVLRSGSAGTLVFSGPDGLEVSVDLDPKTQLPRRVRHHGRRSAQRLRANPTEPVIVELADHRSVAGLLLPHRLTTFADGRLHSERTLDAIDINPPLTPGDFTRREDMPAASR